MKRLGISVFCWILLLTFNFNDRAFSQENELFLIKKGEYFSIYGFENIDLFHLLQKLNFNYFLPREQDNPHSENNIENLIAETIDAIYIETLNILGINIYHFHGTIKILQNQEDVSRIFKKSFEIDFEESSFYFYDNNIIYISFEDLTLGMLGHEVAHSILSRYFVVPPPAKIQEVLSGYVEYSLRKETGSLPLK